ncbi:GL20240 [Drosophila persimilis]|uniref:Uncharacterized protein isoform X1 n=2 Tax=pseudoobscura subgroup TaxID=32358 RepID=B5DMF1_DROPS|nr:uncharacterized protein LOC6598188 [Drosophila persimilis]XP_002134044.1 uncharacterized protein LOC6901343 isoform X1 [Drosophila pseudoobscura]EDW27510.1 GL20240 [Drosophila persimilis]
MCSIRQLSEEERSLVDSWLESEGIVLNSRSRRDTYSDVRPVAEILKKIYPEIELECYPTVSSFDRRLQNWQIFAFRVLLKLGLRLHNHDLKQLAEGKPGAVDWVLFHAFSHAETFPKVRSCSRARSMGGVSRRQSTKKWRDI